MKTQAPIDFPAVDRALTERRAKLASNFANTHPSFQLKLRDIDRATGIPVLEVYALWKKHEAANYDQSALLSEFIVWQSATLNPTDSPRIKAALRAAIED